MDIVFVILHYIALEETIQCVNTLKKKVDTIEYKIVVVDNGSPNHSGNTLEKHYESDDDVIVLLNRENEGFARGNNVGFQYAKSKWNPEFIVLMNNDVFLLDDHIYKSCKEAYETSDFAVLGPLIMTAEGRCDCNPHRMKPISDQAIVSLIKMFQKKVFFWKWGLTPIIETFMRKLNTLIRNEKGRQPKLFLENQEDVVLHGCFLVFSRNYINMFEGLDERTFLYYEEDILYLHVKMQGMKTLYYPKIQVFHEEDVSTDSISGKNKQKQIFLMNNHINSLNVLRSLNREFMKQKEYFKQ